MQYHAAHAIGAITELGRNGKPALAADMPWLMAHVPPALLAKLREIVLTLAHAVWEGERPLLTWAHLAEEARRAPSLSNEERAALEEIIARRIA